MRADTSWWRSCGAALALVVLVVSALAVWAAAASGGPENTPAASAGASTEGSDEADGSGDFSPVEGDADAAVDRGPTDESGNPVSDSSPEGLPPEPTVPPGTAAVPTVASTTLPDAPVEPPSVPEAEEAVVVLLDRSPDIVNPVVEEDGPAFDVTRVAADALLAELLATAVEFEALGWTQVGSPRVDGVTVLQAPTDESPIDAVIEVCVDSSDVRIVDSDGNDVRTGDTPTRSLNIFTLRLVDDRWVAADQSFPDDPDC